MFKLIVSLCTTSIRNHALEFSSDVDFFSRPGFPHEEAYVLFRMERLGARLMLSLSAESPCCECAYLLQLFYKVVVL